MFLIIGELAQIVPRGTFEKLYFQVDDSEPLQCTLSTVRDGNGKSRVGTAHQCATDCGEVSPAIKKPGME